MLADGLGVRHVVVGADFRFGKGRAGDAAALRALGAAAGFGVTVAPLVSDGEGDFSSTAIREALGRAAGRRRPRASSATGTGSRARCEHGDKRGRTLGFPTANLRLDGLHLPRFGVYAVLVDVLDGPHRGRYRGVGLDRRAADLRRQAAEPRGATCFDFDGDLYGEVLSVALVAYLRPELKFDGVGAAGGADARSTSRRRARAWPAAG